jgi:3-hydroxybutyryl-CoA dehydrogenase
MAGNLTLSELVMNGVPQTISRVLVIGAGTMGSGIAQVIAQARIQVTLCDSDSENLRRGLEAVNSRWEKLTASGRHTAEESTEFASFLTPGAVADAVTGDLIIEAVVEKRELKSALFAELATIAPPSALFASNTSSISISALGAASRRPDRFVGMHFFNPVPVMPLVEIVRGLETSDQTLTTSVAFVARLGKTPIVVDDAPGFVANRILLPMINEAIFTLQDGVAPKQSIDDVLKLGMSHPMGPLALADLIGLDVCLDILETLHRDFGEDKYRPAPLLRRMVASGKLGRKSGEGFYSY